MNRTGTTTLTAAFKYDLAGRRTEKTINNQTVRFIYDGAQMVGEQRTETKGPWLIVLKMAG